MTSDSPCPSHPGPDAENRRQPHARVLPWLRRHRADFDAVALDIDGVLINHCEPTPGSGEMVHWLRQAGVPLLLLTNDGCNSAEEKTGDLAVCGLHFEREQGYWAGALAINIIATGGLFAIVFVALLAVTIPDVPVVELLIVLVPIALLGPIVYYPFSKTVWVAVDRAFLMRLDANERLD